MNAWVEERLGPRAWAPLGPSTWTCGEVVLRVHRAARPWLQEERAYTEVLPALGDGAPRRIAADRASRSLLVERVPGQPTAAWLAAGAWLARLHALPCADADPCPLPDALAARRDAWLRRAPGELRPTVEVAFGDPAWAAPFRRVWCHRDYEPRNWLAAPGRFAVVDFEHTLPDLHLVDLVKLEADLWTREPGARAAFFEGYGRSLTPDEEDGLRRLVVLHGLQTWIWGRTHGDAAFEALGARILGRLRR